jgi:hypothetical protein
MTILYKQLIFLKEQIMNNLNSASQKVLDNVNI